MIGIGEVRTSGAARAAFAHVLALLAMLAIASPAMAQNNSIESVSSIQQGAATILKIALKSAPGTPPASFQIANPPRIALDMPATDNGTGQSTIDLAQGDVRNVNIVQAAGRARIVLNLKKALTYNTTVDGSNVVIALEPIAAANLSPAPGSASTFNFAKGDTQTQHALRDLDFRRGKDGEGRIVVEMSDAQTGVDIRQVGQVVQVDFLKTRLPENLRKRLDVADFGTPVKGVRIFQQGDNARMVIEPTGLWEHNAYQSDNQFVVEVKPVKEDPTRLRQGTRVGYQGEKLSLNFQNVDIRALLQVIADFTNLNIVTSDSVGGNLTLRLKDVPWDQALDIVLQSKGLDVRKNGNVLLIAPREELATKEKLDLEAKQQISDIEPLRTEVFQLNYQKAEVLGKLLVDDKQRVLSKRGGVVIDARTNKLFIQDTGARLDEVRKMIQQTDIAIRQVLIEARIVEANDLFSRNLGAKLGYTDNTATVYKTVGVPDPVSGTNVAYNVPVYGAGNQVLGNTYATISGNLSGVRDLSSQNGCGLTGQCALGLGQATAAANTNFVNLPAAAISGNNPASIAVSLFGSGLTKFLNLELSALEADQTGKVISSPRVLTSDQGKAVIEQGTELPYQQSTASGATSVAFRKANLRLEVIPQITPEGSVILDVDVNRDAVGQLTAAGFAIDTRHVKTQVLVENGGTVVIGGIYEQTENNGINKVPFLGDIPVIGYLFRNSTKTNNRTELLVFITPRVVTDVALARQ